MCFQTVPDRITHFVAVMPLMPSSTPDRIGVPDVRQIGFRIRATRRRQKLTQATVAARAGIDKGYLSRIERGEKSASVGTLHMLSVALDTTLAALLGDANPKDEIRIARAADHAPLAENDVQSKTHHYTTILSGGTDNPLSMILVQVGTQGQQEVAAHGGEEVIFVLEGSVKVQFDKHSVVLAKHDSISFPGYLSHSLCAQGNDIARALIMITGESR